MRAGGAHVGVGDLLAAHRALAAVDASQREEAFYALRAALCSSHADMAVFAEAFAIAFAAPEEERDDPLEQLGEIERAALPRMGIPAEAPAAEVEVDAVPDARRLERGGAAARAGLRALHRRRARDRAAAAGAARAARPAAALAPHGADAAAPRGPRPARHDPALAAPRRRVRRAPLPRPGAAAAPAGARVRCFRLDGALRADAADVHAGLRRGARPRRGVRVRHAADARHARARRPRPRPRAAARRRGGRGLVGRHPHRRGDRRRSTACTAAASAAARSS